MVYSQIVMHDLENLELNKAIRSLCQNMANMTSSMTRFPIVSDTFNYMTI